MTVAGVICPQFGSKDSAKNRFSEEKENKLSFLSVRFLFKSKTKQNKSPKTFIFFVEVPFIGSWWKADIGSFAVVLRQAALHELRPYRGRLMRSLFNFLIL